MSIFYEKNVKSDLIQLSEDESRHCSQVLRHKAGDEIVIFDGNGIKYYCALTEVSKKKCVAQVYKKEVSPKKNFSFHIAIAPTKNMDRMEWLVEKLTELGVDQISLLQTKHSERKKIRIDRLEKKAVSAMKQSKNPFLPIINPLTPLSEILKSPIAGSKLIAHVDTNHGYIGDVIQPSQPVTILIGPEGDFSDSEVEGAISSGFLAVSLGTNTLRTETAGLKACCIVSIINQC